MRYQGKRCLVATMHGKENAIRPSFESLLGFEVEGGELNTDDFGTFSGEIERLLPPSECAKEKCLKALLKHGKKNRQKPSSWTVSKALANNFINQWKIILGFNVSICKLV
ncbi:MAG: hypothetical protein JSS32_00135 [Verrucomicrobia bacterium]|nr:hypothetical protein [Verrucomicrobiota bacterium]